MKPMFLSDYNQIYFIATFPNKNNNNAIYFEEIRPLQSEGGHSDLNEITMQKRLEKSLRIRVG
jgi:hypothetical protein